MARGSPTCWRRSAWCASALHQPVRPAERDPGSLYAYVVKGLGPTAGFIVGWGLILAYLTTGIATVAGSASYATTLCDKVDLHIGPYPLYAILAGLVWLVAYRDVRLSARMMLLLEVVSVGLIYDRRRTRAAADRPAAS